MESRKARPATAAARAATDYVEVSQDQMTVANDIITMMNRADPNLDAQAQAIALLTALNHARQQKWINSETYYRAAAWVDAGAYENAALALVCDDWYWEIFSQLRTDDERPVVMICRKGFDIEATASTSALAIGIAVFRARIAL